MTKRILIFIVIPLLFLSLTLTTIAYRELYRDSQDFHKKELFDFAQALSRNFSDVLRNPEKLRYLDSIFKEIDSKTGKRITIVDTSGVVLLDTRENPFHMDNHRWRPEIRQALKGETSFSFRFSHTLKTRMLYCAIPIYSEDKIVMVLRVSEPESRLLSTLRRTRKNILITLPIIFILSIISLLILDTLYRMEINQFINAFSKLSKNNFNVKIIRKPGDFLSTLTLYFNEMAERLKHSFEQLARREAEMKSILESIQLPLGILNEQKVFIYLNEEFRTLFMNPKSSIEGANFEDILDTQLYDTLRNILKSDDIYYQDLLIRKEGKYLKVIIKKLEGVNRIVITAMDISDTIEKERLKKDLITYVSHDLRTPLTIIRGYAETALDEIRDERVKNYIEKILEGTQELQVLVEKLNTLSKLENVPEVDLKEVNLRELVKSVVTPFEHQAKSKGLNLNVEVSLEKFVKTDPEKVKMILVNLLDNAVKFTEKGEVKLFVGEKDENIQILVSDTGPGIPEDYVEKIFERFFTLDKSRSAGFGLGLAIVKHAVKALNGKIEVRSQLGSGTTFLIIIPIVKNS
ncbi:MAG: ATP-binding protein [candidate division WOR-3 bacterium]